MASASAFNLLTAGGARFDKTRFKHDHDLFSKNEQNSKPSSSKSRSKAKPMAGSTSQSSLKSGALPADLNLFSDPSSSTRNERARKVAEPQIKSENLDESSSDDEDDHPSPPVQKITISGSDPLPISLAPALSSLTSHPSQPLPPSTGHSLLYALSSAGIRSLWGVQSAVSGCILEGKDVMCVAPTGSGKTLAYVLPTIVALRDPAKRGIEGGGIRAVILVPTHDLAVQIHGVVKAVTAGRGWRVLALAKATERAVCESSPGVKWGSLAKNKKGSTASANASREDHDDEEADGGEEEGSMDEEDVNLQSDPEERGPGGPKGKGALALDILIATPERLHHLVQNKQLSLAKTQHLIMDEADRLLSSDFLPQVEPIIKACPASVQKCLLSATIPAGAEAVARGWMKDGGVRVVVGVKDSAVSTVSQSLLFTATETGKLLALRNLLTSGSLPYPSLIFVQSVQRADDLHAQILMDPQLENVRVGVVHGGKTNGARDEVVQGFREGKVWVLVVTEVMARGMDFGGVKVVVNYDFPQTVQSYIHRIGRTGRAGRQGKAITFYNNEDSPHLRTIANVLIASGCPVPPYMLSLPAPSKNLKRHLAKAPVKRKVVGGGGRDLAKEERKRKGDMVRGSMKRRKGVEGEDNAD